MRNITIVASLALLLASLSLSAQSDKTYYPNGTVKTELIPGKDPSQASTFRVYHANRKLLTEGITDGLRILDGQRTAWNDQGGKWYEYELVDGRIEGVMRWYHVNGTLILEGEFKAGKPVGSWKEWNEKGVLLLSTEVLEDGRVKIIEARDVFREKVIDKGDAELSYCKTMDWQGEEVQVKVEGKISGGFRQGVWKVADTRGRKVEEANFLNGRYDGKVVRYNANGSRSFEGSYRQGRPAGKWVLSNPNGKVERIMEFDTSDAAPDDLPITEEIIWDRAIVFNIPLSIKENIDLKPIALSLFEAAYKGSLSASSSYRADAYSGTYPAKCFTHESFIDSVFFMDGDFERAEAIEYKLGDMDAMELTGNLMIARQDFLPHFSPWTIGLHFTQSDTLQSSLYFDYVQAKRHLLEEEKDTLSLEALNKGEFVSLIEYVGNAFPPESLAEILHASELASIRLHSTWLYLLEEELNLRGVDRRGS